MHTEYFYREDECAWDVKVNGEVDVATASELRTLLRELYEKKAGDIVLDMAELRYMDSTGLGVLIGAYARMQEHGNCILVRNPREHIQKLLRITALDKLFCPQETAEQASQKGKRGERNG